MKCEQLWRLERINDRWTLAALRRGNKEDKNVCLKHDDDDGKDCGK